jgi:hypothetical protein
MPTGLHGTRSVHGSVRFRARTCPPGSRWKQPPGWRRRARPSWPPSSSWRPSRTRSWSCSTRMSLRPRPGSPWRAHPSEGLRAALTALREGGGTSPTQCRALSHRDRRRAQPPSSGSPTSNPPSSTTSRRRRSSTTCCSHVDRSALVSFGRTIRSGRPLTQRQAAYALSLVQQLIDGGAVRRHSPDEDQEVCDVVLDAVGHPG